MPRVSDLRLGRAVGALRHRLARVKRMSERASARVQDVASLVERGLIEDMTVRSRSNSRAAAIPMSARRPPGTLHIERERLADTYVRIVRRQAGQVAVGAPDVAPLPPRHPAHFP